MKNTKSSFTGHAKLVKNFRECKPNQHYLLYSNQFGVINEIVIDEKRGFQYPNQIYYRYAEREQDKIMNLWLNDIHPNGTDLLFKID